MNREKEVWLVSDAYYPVTAPVTYRMHSFARKLSDRGFYPRIFTPDWKAAGARLPWGSFGTDTYEDFGTVHRVPGIKGNQPQSKWKSIFSPLSNRESDVEIMTNFICDHAKNKALPLVILGTGPPYVPLAVARNVSTELGAPWIADMRDIVYQIPSERRGLQLLPRMASKLLGYRQRTINAESRLCNESRLAVTVSDALNQTLVERGVSHVETILNGYNKADFNVDAATNDKFRIIYCGSICVGRDPRILFAGLDLLIEQNKISTDELEVVFFGTNPDSVDKFRSEFQCGKCVFAKPRIPKHEVISQMKGASVLLQLSAPPGVKGIFTSKVTEYMASGTPVISIPGDLDVVDRFLKKTGTGESCSDAQTVAKFVGQEFSYWKRQGNRATSVSQEHLDYYSRGHQGDLFVDLIEKHILKSESS